MAVHKKAHRIRLRKPWHRHDHALGIDGPAAPQDDVTGDGGATDDAAAASVIQVDVPDRSPNDIRRAPGGADRVRRVIYCRKFHRPSGLGPGDRVQLAIGAIIGRIAEIRINAVAISLPPTSFRNESQQPDDIAMRLSLDGWLADHNALEIELESTEDEPDPPRLAGDVNLWIIPSSLGS